jgi:hypothetical protein
LGGCVSLATAARGGSVAWVVPTYKNGRSLWRWAERATADVCRAKLATANKTERMIEFSNGGLFGIYSADNEDSIRGEAFHLVVLDEAAKISETAWTDAIQPTLADHNGDALLISTPRGLNWFFTEYTRGRDDGYYQMAFHAPSSDNPLPNIRKAAELARTRMPLRTYRQEWMAEFIEDGAYFQGIENVATITEPDDPANHQGHYLVMGVDWAMSEDYTVLTVACRDCARVVDWERFNQISFTYQREKLDALAARWGAYVLPERNSIGEPNIELLRSNVLLGPDKERGFNTTATTKPALIQRLATGIEQKQFTIPAEYADELRSYQVDLSPTGHPKFSAPEGMHDDRVISLALAWWGISDPNWYMS